jgi:hypothetical protein
MTKIEEAAKAVWDESEAYLGTRTPWAKAYDGPGGKDRCRAEVRTVLAALRMPDMNLCLEIARETKIPAADIDLAWTRMIDKLLEGK